MQKAKCGVHYRWPAIVDSTFFRKPCNIRESSEISSKDLLAMIAVMWPRSLLTIIKYSVSASEALEIFKKRQYSWLVSRFEPSAILVGTDRAARRSWDVRP